MNADANFINKAIKVGYGDEALRYIKNLKQIKQMDAKARDVSAEIQNERKYNALIETFLNTKNEKEFLSEAAKLGMGERALKYVNGLIGENFNALINYTSDKGEASKIFKEMY